MNGLTSGLIAALVAGIISIGATYTNYRSSLDNISGWRSKLFDAASAKEITLKEVQVLRTALRYEPTKEVQENTFAWISNIMIYYCKYISIKYFEHYETSLLYHEQEIIRVFIRCLLKYHWEYNAFMVSSLNFLKVYCKSSKKPDFIHETYEKARIVCLTLANDDEEYNLIERINERMKERYELIDDEITKNSEENIKEFSVENYLNKYVEHNMPSLDSSDWTDETCREKIIRCLLTNIFSIYLVFLYVIMGVNIASDHRWLGLKPIKQPTIVLAVLLVVLLIINNLFKKKKQKRRWLSWPCKS